MKASHPFLHQRLGAIFGFFGVALGAMAAHGPLHDYLADHPPGVDLWRTALLYQWVHALALLASGPRFGTEKVTPLCWTLGSIFFSGSLYLLGLNKGWTWLGPITPLGGLFLLAGWASLWWKLLRR